MGLQDIVSIKCKVPLVMVIIIVGAAFMTCLCWSCTLPMDLAPDEYMRYDIPEFIVNHGYLPFGNEEEIRSSIWGSSYGFSVYGSTLIAVPFMLVAKALGCSDAQVLVAARFANVLLGSATVLICVWLGQRLFRRWQTAVLFTLLVGFLPQRVFLASYFNSDSLELLTVALIALLLMRGVEHAWRMRDCIFLGIALGLCSISYYYAYGMILVSIVVYFSSLRVIRKDDAQGTRSASWQQDYLAKPLLVFIASICGGAWFLIWHGIIYQGDIFGMATSRYYSELYALDQYKPSNHLTPKMLGFSPIDVVIGSDDLPPEYAGWTESITKSSVGMFGYMNILAGQNTYYAYFIFIGVGFLFGLVRAFSKKGYRAIALIALFTILVPFAITIYYSWASDFQAQGRYVIAGLIGFMFFVALGWEFICELLSRIVAAVVWKVKKDSGKHSVDQSSDKRDTRAFDSLSGVLVLAVSVGWMVLFVHIVNTVIIPLCTGPVL